MDTPSTEKAELERQIRLVESLFQNLENMAVSSLANSIDIQQSTERCIRKIEMPKEGMDEKTQAQVLGSLEEVRKQVAARQKEELPLLLEQKEELPKELHARRDALIALLRGMTADINKAKEAYKAYVTAVCTFMNAVAHYDKSPKELSTPLKGTDWPGLNKGMHENIDKTQATADLHKSFRDFKEDIHRNSLMHIFRFFEPRVAAFIKRRTEQEHAHVEGESRISERIPVGHRSDIEVHFQAMKKRMNRLNEIQNLKQLTERIEDVKNDYTQLWNNVRTLIDLFAGLQSPGLAQAGGSDVMPHVEKALAAIGKINGELEENFNYFMTQWNRIAKEWAEKRLEESSFIKLKNKETDKLMEYRKVFEEKQQHLEGAIKDIELLFEEYIYRPEKKQFAQMLIKKAQLNLQKMREALVDPQRYCAQNGFQDILDIRAKVIQGGANTPQTRDAIEHFLRVKRKEWQEDLWLANMKELMVGDKSNISRLRQLFST